ncbi:MAG: glycosyltransferase [bacterium]
MRVGIVTERYPPNIKGGGEISAYLLARGLKSWGVEVDVLSFDGQGEETHEGIPLKRIRVGRSLHFPVEKSNLLAYPRIKEFCMGKDIIHGYNMRYYPATAQASRILGLPSVLTLTTYAFYYPRHVEGLRSPSTLMGSVHQRISDGLSRSLIARNADALIALSQAEKDIYEMSGFPAEKIRVIPNFLDPVFLKKEPDRSNSEEKTILYVGRLSPEKGVETLIRALALKRAKYQDLKLLIVGAGPSLGELKELAAKLGVDDCVRFCGKLAYTEIRKTYESGSLFVHPGVWPEPFGRGILEAMASGVPVIASDTGSAPELLGGCGLLFEPGNVEQLASRIDSLLGDANLALRLSREGRSRVASTYDSGKVLEQMVSLYREVLDSRSSAVHAVSADECATPGESILCRLRHNCGRLIDRTAVPVVQRMFDAYFTMFRRPDDLSLLRDPRILFVMLTRGIGDAILCTPALNALRKRHPSSNLTVLAIPYVRDLVKKFRSVDAVLSFDIEHPRICDFWRLVRRLRTLRFDVVIDILHDRSIVSPLICFFSGGRNLAGFLRGLRGVFFNHRYRCETEGVHFADVVRNMVNESGLGTGDTPEFETALASQSEREFAGSVLAGRSGPLVCVHPGSKGIRGRRWPEDRWAFVLDKLLQELNCRIVIIGSENEKRLCRNIQERMKGEAVNLAGKCSIGETAGLIAQSDALLCSVSGPLHMAAAMGVPTVYIGGGIDLSRWGPYGDSAAHRAVLRDSNCRPEACCSCPDRWERCTGSVTTDVFLEAVVETIRKVNREGSGFS